MIIRSEIRERAGPSLSAEVERALSADRQRALRCLLRNPLVVASGPWTAEFGLIRRHGAWLRDWLWKEPGWTLQIEAEFARLRKTPADTGDDSHPARDPRGAVFTRRRYVLLCLALAALERADRQTALGKLTEEIETLFGAEPQFAERGLTFTLNDRSDRRDLVGVMRFLLDLGVLTRVHGEEDQFVATSRDVLYTIERSILNALLCVRRGPSTIQSDSFEERIGLLIDEPMPDTDEARNRALRSFLMRRLLEDPVVYYADLEPAQRDYLDGQRPRILREIASATGLIPEVRREGIALVDERDDLTDLRIPEQGTAGHHLLLIAEYLAQKLREHESHESHAATPCRIGRVELEALTARLIAAHRSHWRNDVTEAGAERRMTEETVERLRALSLLRIAGDGIYEPLPAIARYSLMSADVCFDDSDRQRNLFD